NQISRATRAERAQIGPRCPRMRPIRFNRLNHVPFAVGRYEKAIWCADPWVFGPALILARARIGPKMIPLPVQPVEPKLAGALAQRPRLCASRPRPRANGRQAFSNSRDTGSGIRVPD